VTSLWHPVVGTVCRSVCGPGRNCGLTADRHWNARLLAVGIAHAYSADVYSQHGSGESERY